jgi:hypothetical protein
MHAVKLNVEIPRNRLVSLPPSVPTGPAEIIVLTEQPARAASRRRDAFGCSRGLIHMSDDFDAPLPELEEYSG